MSNKNSMKLKYNIIRSINNNIINVQNYYRDI